MLTIQVVWDLPFFFAFWRSEIEKLGEEPDWKLVLGVRKAVQRIIGSHSWFKFHLDQIER